MLRFENALIAVSHIIYIYSILFMRIIVFYPRST